MNTLRRTFLARALLVPAIATTGMLTHRASYSQAPVDASTASSLSLSLPVAMLVAAPMAFLSAGVSLTVVAVEVSAEATVWVVKRASDGTRASLRLSGDLAISSAIAVGSVLTVTVISAGWLLSVAGEVICLVPNALGEALLYNERVR